MPMYDYLFLLDDDHKAGANGNTNSQNEINFGVTSPNVGKGGKFGAHIVITQAYTALNSGINIRVLHGAATSPDTVLVSRLFTQTEMGVLGAHYFIPIPPSTFLQYARLKHAPVSENGTLGKIQAWFGPDVDGSI